MKTHIHRFIVIVTSVMIGAGTYFALAPVAYAQRGYQAYGGEVMLAVAVTVTAAYTGFKILRYLRRKKEAEI